jgi:hypothetical protein
MIGPDSEVLWRLRIAAHHDAAMAPDGSLFVLTNRWIVFEGRQVLFDGIAHVSAEGELLDQWWTFDWLAELQPHHRRRVIDSPPAAGERAGAKQRKRGRTPAGGLPPATTIELRDYYHANSIELLPDTPLGRRDDRFRAGNLMICLHQVDLVMILDQEDYSVTWSWGAGELDWPHMPTMLENGNILVFDNGSHRDFSRVLEIEPPSGRIVWSYEADPPQAFYTKFRGCNQRLPNGNTVICESERGRVFEVTREGRIVWEYWNPIVEEGRRRRISRFTRYPAEFVAPLLEASAAGG